MNGEDLWYMEGARLDREDKDRRAAQREAERKATRVASLEAQSAPPRRKRLQGATAKTNGARSLMYGGLAAGAIVAIGAGALVFYNQSHKQIERAAETRSPGSKVMEIYPPGSSGVDPAWGEGVSLVAIQEPGFTRMTWASWTPARGMLTQIAGGGELRILGGDADMARALSDRKAALNLVARPNMFHDGSVLYAWALGAIGGGGAGYFATSRLLNAAPWYMTAAGTLVSAYAGMVLGETVVTSRRRTAQAQAMASQEASRARWALPTHAAPPASSAPPRQMTYSCGTGVPALGLDPTVTAALFGAKLPAPASEPAKKNNALVGMGLGGILPLVLGGLGGVGVASLMGWETKGKVACGIGGAALMVPVALFGSVFGLIGGAAASGALGVKSGAIPGSSQMTAAEAMEHQRVLAGNPSSDTLRSAAR